VLGLPGARGLIAQQSSASRALQSAKLYSVLCKTWPSPLTLEATQRGFGLRTRFETLQLAVKLSEVVYAGFTSSMDKIDIHRCLWPTGDGAVTSDWGRGYLIEVPQ
jgi:hypothetical protein